MKKVLLSCRSSATATFTGKLLLLVLAVLFYFNNALYAGINKPGYKNKGRHVTGVNDRANRTDGQIVNAGTLKPVAASSFSDPAVGANITFGTCGTTVVPLSTAPSPFTTATYQFKPTDCDGNGFTAICNATGTTSGSPATLSIVHSTTPNFDALRFGRPSAGTIVNGQLKSTSGAAFKLSTLILAPVSSASQTFTVTAFKGGVMVTGSTVTVSYTTSTPNHLTTLNSTNFGSFYDDIDEVDVASSTNFGIEIAGLTTTTPILPATTINSINLATSSPTNAASVTYTATFAASVTGLATTNFSLTSSGVTSPSITGLSGSGTTYTVTVNTGSGDGSIGLNLANATGLTPGVSNTPFTGQSYTIDKTAPTISIGSPSASITATNSVTYTVTYADANFNSSTLTTGNITLNKTNTANGTLGVSGSGTTRTVTISGITGNGTLGISIAAGTATDQAGNSAPASSASTTFTVDNTAPTISIGSPSASITATNSVTYTVTYADANFNSSTLATGNITLNKTGTANGTLGVSGSGTTRTVTISSITGDGSLGISIAAGTATDLAGNSAPSAGPSTTFTVDNTAPTISIGSPSASITSAGPVTYTVTYADANFNSSTLATGNITLNKTGTANGTLGVSGSGTTRTVTISSITGDGSLGISIAAGTATDLAGNSAPSAGPSTTFTVDNTAPTVNIGSPSVSITNTGPVSYTVTYADANFNSSTLSPANLFSNVTRTGTADFSNITVTGTGTTRTVTFLDIIGDGTLSFSIPAGTATDLAGNSAPAAGPSATFIVDNTAPTIAISSPSLTTTNTGPVTYTVTYADANFNSSTLATGNITLNKTGTANGTLGVSGSGTTRTVTISSITGDGSLGISIAAGTATDLAGNSAPASSASATFTVDNTAPTALTLVYQSNHPGNSQIAIVGDVVSLDFTVSEPIQAPVLTIAGHSITAVNTTGNEWLGSYTMTSGDTPGRIPFTLAITDLAGNPQSGAPYSDVAAGDDIEFLSPDAGLSSLSLSTGTLAPAFISGTTSYTASVSNATASIKVTPTTNNANATVTVNTVTVASGSASSDIPLSEGANTITIVVTAQDGTTTDTYTVTVTRAFNSTLSNLVVMRIKNGNSSTAILSPGFNPGTTSYSLDAPNSTSTVTITPTVAEATATVKVNGTTVASGSASTGIGLNVGMNTITTVVTAQDGTTDIYTVSIDRRDAMGNLNGFYEPISVNQAPNLQFEGDGIMVHQALSPNGDGINDVFTIDGLTNYPDNKVTIMNRNGAVVFQTQGYDNSTKVFDGHSNINGVMQLPGTYFYSLEYKDGGDIKRKTGFIVLKY